MSISPEVQYAVITGCFGLAASATGYLIPKLKRNTDLTQQVAEKAEHVVAQVVNGHGSNLRDDIDTILHRTQKLLEGQDLHTSQINILRADLEWERRERMDLARRVEGKNPLG